MYELMLDTANIRDIEEGMNSWPVVGVTTNPSILRNEGDINVYERLADIKRLCGNRSSLHVQVVSSKTADIIDEAHRILDRLGSDVFIKIPVSAEGLPAIKKLAGEGVNITATAIYSALQGILAILSGAKYIAVYYNRMENNCTDPNAVIREIRIFIDKSESSSKILAASFKNVSQVMEAYTNGAQTVTVAPSIIRLGLGMASINDAVKVFAKDFTDVHGEGQTMKTID